MQPSKDLDRKCRNHRVLGGRSYHCENGNLKTIASYYRFGPASSETLKLTFFATENRWLEDACLFGKLITLKEVDHGVHFLTSIKIYREQLYPDTQRMVYLPMFS